MIELMSFLRLRGFFSDQEKNNYNLLLLEHKIDYTQLMERLVALEGKMNRKRKIKKFEQFREEFGACLCELDHINKDQVEKEFKSVSYRLYHSVWQSIFSS